MSELYILYSGYSCTERLVRMSEAQAKAIQWFIDEFELDITIDLASEYDCDDLSKGTNYCSNCGAKMENNV